MENLCQDIFNNISEYLDIIDITKLKRTNKILKIRVHNYEQIYLTKQLNIINTDINIQTKKRYFYNGIKYICYILNNSKMFLNNEILNNMISDIFRYYYVNRKISYPNIINMIVVNAFINILYYPNNVNIYSVLKFFKIFNKQNVFKFQDIIIYYYIYVLNYIHDNIIHNSFKIIYDISPYVINIYCLRKMLSYRILDLSNTYFIYCCNLETCVIDNIYAICDTKNAYYNDDLISHNYREIKTLLYNYSKEYYNILINRENDLLNEKIFIKNPITNRRMRVNGKRWVHLICNLKKKDKNMYNIIVQDVLKQQDILRKKIFGQF